MSRLAITAAMASIRYHAGLVAVAMFLALVPAGPAWAAPVVVEDMLSPTTATSTTPVSATLQVPRPGS
ncbi:hypothetical protein AB0N07_10950 [Streptomyces sp. NPDC051172]|uniref:hypothetical protein n=1 Tax=Streptomyces sp. NPDC051172 TaxID=3155796 RepID=UPI00344538CD